MESSQRGLEGRRVEVRRRCILFLESVIDELYQLRFGQSAYLGGVRLTVFKDNQSGNTPDIELGRRFLVSVHIHFGDFDLAFIGAGQLIQNGGSEEHTSELQSRSQLLCPPLLE